MTLKKMTLEQKIGQLFLVAVPGTELSNDTKAHIQKHHFGNFIYFTQNLTDYKSIRRFSDNLQQTVQEANGVPAFISIDQEGGMVARAYSGATIFPTNMAITASGMKCTKKMGKFVADELKRLGININHAPVVDVNNNPKNPVIGIRSYSDDAKIVAEMAVDYITGLQAGGVMANAKHFPGHGDTDTDSHLALPSISHDMKRLNEIELAPFNAAIANGVDSIMTAHIVFKEIDNEHPATLSPKVLTNLLRKKLKFEGLIITDCMTMKAIDDNYGMAQGCVMAINAGADILCLCAKPEDQSRSYNTVLEAAKTGEIPMETIDKAVARILEYKEKYATGEIDPPEAHYPDHEKLANEISRKSITMHRGRIDKSLFANAFAISPSSARTSAIDNFYNPTLLFSQKVGETFGCDHTEISINPTDDEIAEVVIKAGNAELIFFGAYNAKYNTGQQKLCKALKDAGKEIVVVTLRTPYDITEMWDMGTFISAYEYTERSVNSIIAALVEDEFVGKPPTYLDWGSDLLFENCDREVR